MTRLSVVARWRAGMAVLLAVAAMPVLATIASAHPLGNFTVNRYSGIVLDGTDLRLHYVLDMAEIPAFQEQQDIGSGKKYPTPAAYLDARVPEITSHLSLRVDGNNVSLTVSDRTLGFPAGQAGLNTLRLEVLYSAPKLALGSHSLTYHDGNYGDRLGWKEITAKAAGQARLQGSDVPIDSASEELKSYPQDQLSSPLNVTSASMTAVPGLGGGSLPSFLDKAGGGFRVVQDRYSELVAASDLTPLAMVLSLLLAVALGAAHALSPGHGKAVMAAYLVGTRRSPRHAVVLGGTITLTHTVGVFAFGLITLFLSAIITPERLYPYLALASGLLVMVLGIGLVISRTRLALTDPTHHHTDGEEPTGSTHDHGLGEHSHAVPGGAGGMRSLVAMGITGGLLPCPSALIVLLSAIALHRVAYGLVLIVAFSLGLAGVLTGIGVALATGLPLLKKVPGRDRLPKVLRLTRFLSVGAALVITIAGIVLTVEAVPQVV